jgi:hypothetical protein
MDVARTGVGAALALPALWRRAPHCENLADLFAAAQSHQRVERQHPANGAMTADGESPHRMILVRTRLLHMRLGTKDSAHALGDVGVDRAALDRGVLPGRTYEAEGTLAFEPAGEPVDVF